MPAVELGEVHKSFVVRRSRDDARGLRKLTREDVVRRIYESGMG